MTICSLSMNNNITNVHNGEICLVTYSFMWGVLGYSQQSQPWHGHYKRQFCQRACN